MQKKKKMWLVVILPDSETSKDTCLSMIVKVETCGQRTTSKSWESTDFQGSELEPASKCKYSIWGSSSSTDPLIHSKYCCWLICISTCQQVRIFLGSSWSTHYCLYCYLHIHSPSTWTFSTRPTALSHLAPCPRLSRSLSWCADWYRSNIQVCWSI